MTDDDLLAESYRLQAQLISAHPALKALDLRILGAIINAQPHGLPLAFVRTQPERFGTLTAFMPAIERLIEAGLVERRDVFATPTAYKGKGDRPDRREVVYFRTAKPLVEFVL